MQRAPVDGDGAELEYEVRGAPRGSRWCSSTGPSSRRPTRRCAPSRRSRPATGWCATTGAATPAARACRRRSASPSRPPTAGRCCGGWASSAPTSSATPPVARSRCSWRWTRRRSSTPSSCWSRRCWTSPAGRSSRRRSEPAFQLYQAGDTEGASDGFLRVAIGPAYRGFLDELIPGAYAQAVADADTFFAVELPSVGEWRFTREDARRIGQPVLAVLGSESAKDWAGWPEVQARVQEWMPQAEPFVLAGANHALEEMDPRGVAEAMAAFFARHPIPAPRLGAGAAGAPARPAPHGGCEPAGVTRWRARPRDALVADRATAARGGVPQPFLSQKR